MWLQPMMAFSGVRSSCERTARNSSFARLAASASRYRRALSIASPARRPTSVRIVTSSSESGRSGSLQTKVMTPNVRPRAVSGATSTQWMPSARRMRTCSSSRAPATSIASVIAG